jgi:pyridoxal biosynthesis lyase PdxS
MAGTNGNGNGNGTAPRVGTDRVKQGLAQMLKGGVIVSTLVSDDADGRSRDGGGGRMASVLLTSIPQNCMAKL